MSLTGPRESVLDYAAVLFADAAARPGYTAARARSSNQRGWRPDALAPLVAWDLHPADLAAR